MPINVSVIVPVFNAEKYLRQCIDSILSQSYTDFELLLIDDGSKDKSGDICDEYARKDDKVRVFHKENGGVSSARNLGLDNAKGEWVTFVDSDDCLNSRAFDLMPNLPNVDLVICSYRVSKLYININENVILQESLLKESEDLKNFIEFNLHRYYLCTPWSKLFKRTNIGNLRFDVQIRFGEDTIFVLKYLSRMHSCYITDTLFYVYHPSPLATFSKYKLSANEFFYTLHQILEAYRSLGVHSIDFEKRIFYLFSLYRQNLKERDLYLWYKNPEVLWLYKRLKDSFEWNFRIRYKLMSIPIVAKIKRLVANSTANRNVNGCKR